MSQKVSMKLIPALLLVAFSGQRRRVRFSVASQGSGLGNAYAGSAAKASDASTIFWNPAGMTQLQAREVSGGLTAVKPSFKFDNSASQVGVFNAAGDGGDAGAGVVPEWLPVLGGEPGSVPGSRHWCAFWPEDRSTTNPGKGSAQSNEFDIKTININPSIAYRVNDMVSLGAGVSWQKIEADYYKRLGPPGRMPGSEAHLSIDDDAWGWNLGACSPSRRRPRSACRIARPFSTIPTARQQLSSNGTAGSQRDGLATDQGPAERRQGRYQGAGYLHSERDAETQRPLGDARRCVVDGLEFDRQCRHRPHLGAATGRTAETLPALSRIPTASPWGPTTVTRTR
jgi:hypothetical protein